MTINTFHEDAFNSKFRYAGTYLHGKLENDKGFDIFSFSEETNFNEGIHNIVIDNKKCVFVLWLADQEGQKMHKWRGLLVYRHDLDAFNHALEAYHDKRQNI